jgi:hypothetical protein
VFLTVLVVAVIAVMAYLLAMQGPAPAPAHSHQGTTATRHLNGKPGTGLLLDLGKTAGTYQAFVYNVSVSGTG